MIFDIFVILCFLIFLFEISIYIYGEYDYFNTFYFYLDVISTIFLIFDLTFI